MYKEFLRSIIVRLITWEAKAVLKKYRPNIILVTGSVGKTSAKDAAYAALKGGAFVRKSEKSYNSDIGAPLTILGVPNGWNSIVQWAKNLLDGALLLLITAPYPRWLILEVGADRPGDISRALSWLTPTIVIATRFPAIPVHVEFYDSPASVIAEELYPVSRLTASGTAVVNADDANTALLKAPNGAQVMRYGFGTEATLRATRFRTTKKRGVPNGIAFDVFYLGETVSISLPGVIGRTHAYAILAGIGGALAAGGLSSMEGIGERYEAPPGRLRLIEGLSGSVLVDDSYNSSPAAAEEALHALEEAPRSGKRIAVLGDMLELGGYSVQEHTRIGALAASGADMLVTVGVRARGMAEGARQAGMPEDAVHTFERGSDAAAFLLSTIGAGDVVLVKGSQSMRMERIVKALMAHQEDAPRLLPRQDPEWLAR